jgi:tetratricopeptide (TPR) repeat protein
VAPLAAQKGFNVNAGDLSPISAELRQAHSSGLESPLYARLESSLGHLPEQHRRWVKALAVFQGGFHSEVLRMVLELDDDKAEQLALALVQAGLAEYQNHAYFSLDPALSPYLKAQLSAGDYAGFQQRWLAAMQALIDFLHEQKLDDAQLAAELTLLELPNILALLTALQQQSDSGQTAAIAGLVEQLLADLQQPQALALAVKIRQQASETGTINVWSHRQFENKRLYIERLLQEGDLTSAYQQAEALLKQALQAGLTAYQDADYDIETAHSLLDGVLSISGLAEDALVPFQQAKQGFQNVDEDDNKSTARMDETTLSEQGDYLTPINWLDEAAEQNQQCIKLPDQLNDKRDIATDKMQLATVYLQQNDYKAALAAFMEAKDILSQLNERHALAAIWHQTGMVYRKMQEDELAERAYRQALTINRVLDNQQEEANSLNELANIYADRGKLDRAVLFYRQAADIVAQLDNKLHEGLVRSNLANTLIHLQRYTEARNELQRALESKTAFGHSAQPWKTWAILRRLEQACNDNAAAYAAKQRAIQSYLAYRRDGGENINENRQLYQRVLQAIHENNIERLLKDLRDIECLGGLPRHLKSVIPKIIAILKGGLTPALADDPELAYDDAAELLLLLEALPKRQKL